MLRSVIAFVCLSQCPTQCRLQSAVVRASRAVSVVRTMHQTSTLGSWRLLLHLVVASVYSSAAPAAAKGSDSMEIPASEGCTDTSLVRPASSCMILDVAIASSSDTD